MERLCEKAPELKEMKAPLALIRTASDPINHGNSIASSGSYTKNLPSSNKLSEMTNRDGVSQGARHRGFTWEAGSGIWKQKNGIKKPVGMVSKSAASID